MNEQLIILFDGVCNFCNFWVNFVIDGDQKDHFRFAALQSKEGQSILNDFGLSKTDFDTFILVDGRKYFIKSTAVLKIARKLNYPVKSLYYLIIIPRFIRDFVYSIIAKSRYKFFGKREVCRIPTNEEKQKFL